MLRTINPFIYQRILDKGMPNPDIPCYIHESYAQCYEDTILDGLVRAYLIRHQLSTKDLAYLDIGANHPVATSNTFLLHIFHGITGILVDANYELIPALITHRQHDKVIHAAVTNTNEKYVTLYLHEKNELSSLSKEFLKSWNQSEPEKSVEVPAIRVMNLLSLLNGKKIILSVDVEGLDQHILEDIDYDVVKPFAIVVEHNDHTGPEKGNSIINFLSSRGYFLYAKTNVNFIFSLL